MKISSSSRERSSLVPVVLDFSVTDYCNADCGFCGFARRQMKGKPRRFADGEKFVQALPILKRRGIRYLNFQGGEPLLHPRILDMVEATRAVGMKPSLITNGWKLPEKADALADAGLQNLYISIDSADLDRHEENRGLRHVRERIAEGIERLKVRGIPAVASVTVSKLVDFEALPATLARLGFEGVNFSYPRKEALGSNSLVYGGSSPLVDYTAGELIEALESILRLKRRYPVLNPAISVRDIQRHVRGEPEHFACIGGYKYFYMDWSLDIWRCEAWHEPMGSVFELDHLPDRRERCTNCMMSCYRDASTLMHSAVAMTDAWKNLLEGRPLVAARTLFDRRVVQSARAGLAEVALLSRLARQQGKATAQTRATDPQEALP